MKALPRLTLAIAIAAIAVTSGVAHAGGGFDNLKCFKIRDSLVNHRTIYLADIYPEAPLAARADCRIRLPASHFCVNVAADDLEVNGEVDGEPFETFPVNADPSRDYLCYDLKCDRDRLDVDAFDRFGARALRIRKSDFLCMPANKILPSPEPTDTVTPTFTPTPAPTSTPNPNTCRLIIDAQGDAQNFTPQDICGGDCDPGFECAFTGDPGGREVPCSCVPALQLCSSNDMVAPDNQTGTCGGFCPSPLAICTGGLGVTTEGGRGPACQCLLP